MNAFRVTATFEATHEDKDESPHLHGHLFTVTVEEQIPTGGEMRRNLVGDLAVVLDQLHLKKLSDMLYGGSQSLTGIGSWVMERLLLEHPRITEVTVTTGNATGVVRREVR